MNRHTACGLIALTGFALAPSARAQTFASSVVSYANGSTNPLYDNPAAALGQPTTLISDPGQFGDVKGTYHASMVFPAFNTDPNGSNLLVALGSSGLGTLTVAFDTPITHSDTHWYGDDFIVYGNSFFPANSTALITPTTDMGNYFLGNGGIYQNGVPTVSVSADDINFVTLSPQMGNFYPDNAYAWDTQAKDWGAQNDFTKPVNPSLTTADFAGKSVAYADDTLYNGAAGGAAFSLAGSGLSSIQYVRFTGMGNIDGVARVSDASSPATVAVPESSDAWLLLLSLPLLSVARRRKTSA